MESTLLLRQTKRNIAIHKSCEQSEIKLTRTLKANIKVKLGRIHVLISMLMH